MVRAPLPGGAERGPAGGRIGGGPAPQRDRAAPLRRPGGRNAARLDHAGRGAAAAELGVTKVQLGVQSLDDAILARNGRGHDVAASRQALRLLRLAGFKVVVHWMPNLLGATPESDRADFRRLWDDPALRPDEIKIYPTALLPGTALYGHWQRGGPGRTTWPRWWRSWATARR